VSDPRRYVELILANRIFAALEISDAAALYKAGELLKYPPGHTLFHQGDEADGFFLILSGSLTVIGTGGEKLATLGVGETVGEMGLVMAGPRSARVATEETSLVWYLSGSVFEDLLQQGDPIGTSILRGVGRDMCHRFRKVVDEGERLTIEIKGGARSDLEALGWDF